MNFATVNKKLGDLLVAQGVIDADQLQTALGHQRRWGGRLGEILVGLGFASEKSILRALSQQLGVPEVDLSGVTIAENALAQVPFEMCRKHRLVPLAVRRDEKGAFLHVAMADPSDLEAIDDLRFRTGLRVEVAVAPAVDIEHAIRKHYRHEIELDSPFGEARKLHESTGELIRFGEEVVDLESQPGAIIDTTPRAPLRMQPNGAQKEPAKDLRDLFGASDPALRAVETLVRILTRKGILEKGEYLREVLRDFEDAKDR